MAKLLKFVKDVFVDSDEEKPSDAKASGEEGASLVSTSSPVSKSLQPVEDELRRTSRGEPTAGSRAAADHIRVSPNVVPRTKMTLPERDPVTYRGQQSRSSSSSPDSSPEPPRRTTPVDIEKDLEASDLMQERAFNPPLRKTSTSSLPRKPSLGVVRPPSAIPQKPEPAANDPKKEVDAEELAIEEAKRKDAKTMAMRMAERAQKIEEEEAIRDPEETKTKAEQQESQRKAQVAEEDKSSSQLGQLTEVGASSASASGASDDKNIQSEGAVSDGDKSYSPLGWPTSRLGEVKMPSELVGGIGPYCSHASIPAEPWGPNGNVRAQPVNANPVGKTSYLEFRAQRGKFPLKSESSNLSPIAEVADESSPPRKLSYVEMRQARLAASTTYQTEAEKPVRKLSYAEMKRAGRPISENCQTKSNAESEQLDIRRKQSYTERRKVVLGGNVAQASAQVSKDHRDQPALRKGSYAEIRKKTNSADVRTTRLASHDANLEAAAQARQYRPEIVQNVRKSTYVRKSVSSAKENEPDGSSCASENVAPIEEKKDAAPIRKMSYGEKRREKWQGRVDAADKVCLAAVQKEYADTVKAFASVQGQDRGATNGQASMGGTTRGTQMTGLD